MNNFLVLGIIPGTNIQISFEVWLTTAAVLACGAVYAVRGLQAQPVAAKRLPLHASRLHRRA